MDQHAQQIRAKWRRRRLPRPAHPAHVGAGLRRALPPGPRRPESVARSMDRIEAEATRMSRLVDDLLLLARLDQQRPPVHCGRSTSAGCSAYAVDAVRVTDPDRTYDLDDRRGRHRAGRSPTSSARCSTTSCRNARIHTPPGTTVDARVDTDRRRGP